LSEERHGSALTSLSLRPNATIEELVEPLFCRLERLT